MSDNSKQEFIQDKKILIDALLANTISHKDLLVLCNTAVANDLREIVVRVFDMDEKSLLKKAAVTGFTAYVNKLKNNQRSSRYKSKIKSDSEKFRTNPLYKIVLAEGDSWFNYPLILSDVLDFVSMEPNIALYSVAEGADWFLNMINKREYVEGLGIHNPHFFLLSGGGNDIVGLSRVAVIVNRSEDDTPFASNEWVRLLVKRYFDDDDIENKMELPQTASFSKERLLRGVKHLNKDYFALLMLFKVQYHYVIGKLLIGEKDNDGKFKNSKYRNLKIITQGYDYPIPDSNDGLGIDLSKWYVPLLRKVNHGNWLRMPLLIKGVPEKNHKDVMYAMIFLFNEMMIDVAKDFCEIIKEHYPENPAPRVFHVDNRGIVPESGWTDELHPTPKYFQKVARLFIKCINEIKPVDKKCQFVYSVNDLI
ncbi:MAG: hypothetical protein HYR66_03475 [Sphingobacteriales bacterium]|nr:hypothetical protein [Sphingobacteriales bacterium]MBI3720240.1 hypothetical protein [Sphingobacteriales bacterium]